MAARWTSDAALAGGSLPDEVVVFHRDDGRSDGYAAVDAVEFEIDLAAATGRAADCAPPLAAVSETAYLVGRAGDTRPVAREGA